MEIYIILCGIIAICLVVYYYLTLNYDFWKLRGVRGPQPIPGFGNLKDITFSLRYNGDVLKDIYNEYKNEPVIGIFDKTTPILIIRDPDLIKDVLIKDFPTFANRGIPITAIAEPLSQNIFALDPEKWRAVRNRFSPLFAPAKLKEMCSLMLKCGNNFEQYIDKITKNNEPVECRELAAKYTTDVFGDCVFGIEMNALKDENSEFRRVGKLIYSTTWTYLLRSRVRQSLPWLYNILGYILPGLEITTFFKRLVIEAINYREINNISRHDFIEKLRELKQHLKLMGVIHAENFIASQAYLFFKAGFETTSGTISNALYELALNQEIQKKLREEIDQEYTKNDGDLIYEYTSKVNYLDKVFKETLRKYPPAGYHLRQSTASYTFKGTTITVPENQKVWVPVYAIQYDPDIYPKPDIFDPERFNEEAMQSRHAMHYLPFSDGPRNCMGYRFAVYQVKIALIKILLNYKVEICDKTQIPYVIDPKPFLLTPKNGIYLKLIKINRT